jgi:hypothetical protein
MPQQSPQLAPKSCLTAPTAEARMLYRGHNAALTAVKIDIMRQCLLSTPACGAGHPQQAYRLGVTTDQVCRRLTRWDTDWCTTYDCHEQGACPTRPAWCSTSVTVCRRVVPIIHAGGRPADAACDATTSASLPSCCQRIHDAGGAATEGAARCSNQQLCTTSCA